MSSAHIRRLLFLALTCTLLVSVLAYSAQILPLYAQTPQPTATPSVTARQVANIVKNMSPTQKVGQLFMISYPGNDPIVISDVADLLVNYRVGGVFLRATNQNFINATDTSRQIADLTNRLQTLAVTSTLTTITTITGSRSITNTEFVPLFIAISQENEGGGYTDIIQGLTPLPSQMTLGATWNPEYAEGVGRILGSELSKLGVNMFLGPRLDVLDVPRPTSSGDLGTRVFGGDPFWVGQFASAFTSGVHAGSNNRIAVIAKHFPGLGASDRNITEEIPTVQKSLEQLKQIELAPFFNVMSSDPKLQRQTVDGLLVSHIRYRGFQGNIRANTSPISLDPQAHQALMQLPEVAPWRNAGGVTFSDVLGVQSVRRFYDPLDTSFNARRVARDAFSAGNDVLILGNFALTNSWQEQIANIRDTLQFFKLQYVNDQQFAAKVDAALTRIISLKLRMYGLSTTTITATSATSPFNINDAQVDINNLGTLGAPSEATTRLLNTIGKDSLTLIAPSIRDLSSLITSPPSKDDAIVFITDDRQLRDCARCNLYQAISRTALQDIAVNLYGPRTTGQINPNKINSITFSDLAEVLKPVTNTSSSGIAITANLTATTSIITPTESSAITRTNIVTRLQSVIEQSNWIVIGMLDFNTVYKSTQIFRDFLSQRSDLLRDKKVVLFAFGAPYYLDATEISKLTAYYGIFSRTPIAYETAIRTLFGEFSSAGNSPVSVASINYSIIAQTAPNPNQVIPLVAPDTFTNTAQLQPSQQQIDVKVNDKLKLRAGPVIDRNNRIVPDGTPVQFILTYPAERLDLPIITQPSKSGFAEATITIDRKGNLTARVQSDQATTSYTLRVNTGDTNTQIETIKPTPQPSPSPLPIPTTFVRPTEIPSVTITPTPTVITRVVRANLTGFVLVLLAMGLLGLLTNFALQNTRRVSALYRWRVILWGWIAGWLAYVFVAMGLPGSNQISVNFGWMGGALLALVTAVFVIAVLFLFQFASHLKDTN